MSNSTSETSCIDSLLGQIKEVACTLHWNKLQKIITIQFKNMIKVKNVVHAQNNIGSSK